MATRASAPATTDAGVTSSGGVCRVHSRQSVLGSSVAALGLAVLGCAGGGRAGRQLLEIGDRIGGVDRTALLLLPSGWSRQKRWPMVLVAQHAGTSPRTATESWGFADACDRRGWIGLFPTTPKDISAEREDPWFPVLVDRVAQQRSGDRTRLCAAGFSGGQSRVYAFAARHSGLLAAIGGGGGKVGYREMPASEWDPRVNEVTPISVMHFHGEQDRAVPVEGGVDVHKASDRTYTIIPVREGLEIWAEAIGATTQSNADPPPGVPARCNFHRWKAPTGHVVEGITDPDLGHAWPTWGTDVVMDFFARVPAKA